MRQGGLLRGGTLEMRSKWPIGHGQPSKDEDRWGGRASEGLTSLQIQGLFTQPYT